jgi:RimJ/RimL family protein N-acetyltransferase
MMDDLFRGELVCLVAQDAETMGKAMSRWRRDTEFARLLDDEPAQLWSAKSIKEWIEKDQQEENQRDVGFLIRTLQDGVVIGFVGLFVTEWQHGDAWVGIGIGEREYWGKGYGTDAMRLVLRYGFQELNLRRITLGVFDYNSRAFRSYEKAGFRVEGRERGALRRDGTRADVIIMGILREEWAQQAGALPKLSSTEAS